MNAPPPGDRWWLTAIYAALAAFAVTALALWFPLWWGTVPLVSAAIAVVIVLVRNPRHRFYRLAGTALGAAALSGFAPSVNAAIQISPGRFGTLIIDNSPAITISLAIAAIAFAVLDAWQSRPPSPGKSSHNTTVHVDGNSNQTAARDIIVNQGAVDLETFKTVISRYEANIRDRDHRLGGLETENASLKRDLANALTRASTEAAAGDVSAQAAIAEARTTGDVTKLQSVLTAEADRRHDEVIAGATDYLGLCREIAALAFIRGDIDESLQRLKVILRFVPDDLDAHNRLGHIQQLRGELDSARESYTRVLNKAPNDSTRAVAYCNLGTVALTIGNIEEAIQFYTDALAIADAIGDDDVAACIYSGLGISAELRDDLDMAEALYKLALRIDEKLERPEGIARSYGGLGNVALKSGALDDAERLYAKALAIAEECRNLNVMATLYGNCGIVMQARGDLGEAERNYRKALEINQRLGGREGMALQYNNLGIIANMRNDTALARQYWTQARDLFTEGGMPHMVLKMEEQLRGLIPAGDQRCN